MSKINILVIPSDLYGVGSFRFIEPHVQIQKLFPDDFNIEINPNVNLNDLEYLSQFDIIIGGKDLFPYEKAIEILPKLKEVNTKVIIDIDDYWTLNPSHPQYHYSKEIKYGEKVVKFIPLVDYITTTTDYFADEIRKFNNNVVVFPNAIDPTSKKFQIKEEKSDRIRVAFLGGSTHLKDLEILKPAFVSINEKYKDRLQTVLCGFDTRGETYERQANGQVIKRAFKPKEICWYEYEKIFTANYKHLSKEYFDFLMKFKNEEYPDVANEQYRRVWTKPMSTYSLNYNLFDISLAPLELNKFNLCKSQLKVIEAGFFKKAFVGSEISPYMIDIKHGENGFLVNNKNDKKNWAYYLKNLIDNPELIKDMGEKLYETVKDKYDIRNVSKDRAEFYKTIVE